MIVHDITDPYFAEVVRGVEDGASAAGYLVITCSSERDAVRERSYVRLLRSMRAAAVVFAGSGLDDAALNEEMDRHLAAMRADGAAVVHLSPHAGGAPEVGVDNAAGIAAMVAALVELGHREIAFLAGPRSLFVAGERLAGYRRGLEAAGIAYDERLVVRTTFDAAGGALGVDTLRAGGVPFTAVCCANDLLAIGALQRLAALGVDVPGEVSVAGFDDISTAALTAPGLSTVRLPLRDLGRLGFQHADAMLAGNEPAPIRLPTTVVLRGSTARVSDGLTRSRAGSSSSPAPAAGSGRPSPGRQPREGASVAVHYRTGASEAEKVVADARAAGGADARAFQADLSDGDAAERLVRDVVEAFGRLDGLVNNAGMDQRGPTLELRQASGTPSSRRTSRPPSGRCTRRIPVMLEQGSGSIVNIASRLGQMGIAETAAYSAAKAGLIGLTRSLAREFGPKGIRINAVAPGVTITEMTTDLVESDEGRRRLRDMALGRFGRADEVAAAVVFLLSDAASLFTGQTLNPNAGGYMP